MIDPFPQVQELPLAEEVAEWTEEIMESFQDEFAKRYPEMSGDLTFDHEHGTWKVKGPNIDEYIDDEPQVQAQHSPKFDPFAKKQ